MVCGIPTATVYILTNKIFFKWMCWLRAANFSSHLFSNFAGFLRLRTPLPTTGKHQDSRVSIYKHKKLNESNQYRKHCPQISMTIEFPVSTEAGIWWKKSMRCEMLTAKKVS